MIKQNFLKTLLFVYLLGTGFAQAFSDFIIKDIQVRGLQRVSVGTIFNYFSLTVGDTVTDKKLADAVKNLYRRGMFKDISVEQENGVIILRILERPIINILEFSGNKDIKSENLETAFKQLGLSEGRVLNKPKLEKAKEELRQQYIAKGRYGTKVIIHQVPLERNRVALNIEVQEGVQALVQQIKFIGNNQISDDKLLSKIGMTPPIWWEILSTRNRFSQESLIRDANAITQFYINQGFINFKMLSYRVVLTHDKKNIVVSYQMDEGKKFSVNEITLLGVESEKIQIVLDEILMNNADKVYSRVKLNGIKRQLENKLGDLGYALSKVQIDIEPLTDRALVDVDYVAELGQITYVREIKIIGNHSTRDGVIRRELRIYEGSRFSASKIKLSTARLRRLGFFESVVTQIKPIEGSINQVDLIYRVVETSTGSAKVGMTYGESSGPGISLQLAHSNFLGTGKKFSLDFITSKVNKTNQLTVSNPYFTKNGASFSYGVFNKEKDTSSISAASYIKEETGFSGTLGVPVNEYDRIYFGARLSNMDFSCGKDFDECNTYLDKSVTGGTGTATISYSLNAYDIYLRWSRDSRNNGIFPTEGTYQNLSFTKALGDANYQKTSYLYKHYTPIFNKSAIKLTSNLAYGIGKDGKLPFFTRYFVGGIGSVRGFSNNSLTKENDDGKNIGGSFKTVFNIDLITPFPLAPDSPSVRMSTFIDAGFAFEQKSDFDINKLNSSFGISVLWRSPIAPLTFTYAFPIKSNNSDNETRFQFQLGSAF